MDSKNFDQLARALGAGGSRRGLLKAVAGAAAGAFAAGLGGARAAGLRSPGNACKVNGDCASGLCLIEARSRGICQCRTDSDCPVPAGQCRTAVCSAGACGSRVTPGAACDDGNPCTAGDVCQASGVCSGAPVSCAALDQCHVPGVCNPRTGVCSNPAKPDGASCDDGDLCTQSDACLNGDCVGSNPVACAALDQCHDAGVCDRVTGVCSNPAKQDGAPCDDGDACTQTDACLNGDCVGSNPVACTASDQCHDAGLCDSASGLCSSPEKADGSACQSGGQDVTCLSGACCVPTTCDAAGVQCGAVSDGCNATLQCGTCGFGFSCHDGQCICPSGSVACGGVCLPGNCCTASQCTGGGACDTATCETRFVGQSLHSVCTYTPIAGCCASDHDCALDPCDVSVSCDLGTGTCVHQSACFGCNVCDPVAGGCTLSNCPQCQYCGPGGVCAADSDADFGFCIPPGSPADGICDSGDCVLCIPNDHACQGSTYGDECCSGKCLPDINGGLGDYVCTCRTLIEYCDNDAQCCQGNCAYDALSGLKTCQS